MLNNLGPQFFERDDDDEGPYCSNCSSDFEEVFEWEGDDRQAVRPENRVPCKGCGKV